MLDGRWYFMILLGKRSERQFLLTERLVRGQRLRKEGCFFVTRRRTAGITLDAITAKAFQVREFEHEGLERGIDSVSDAFLVEDPRLCCRASMCVFIL